MNYNTHINRWLTEAITVGRDIQLTSPLKDSDVIRVYHGFYNPLDAIILIYLGSDISLL